jgi:hypothetical protein
LPAAARRLLRRGSTIATGGLDNAVVSTGELSGALLVSLLALLGPLAAVAILVAFCWLAIRFVRRLFRRIPAEPTHE